MHTYKKIEKILEQNNMTIEKVVIEKFLIFPKTRYFVRKKDTNQICKYAAKLSVIYKWIIKNGYRGIE